MGRNIIVIFLAFMCSLKIFVHVLSFVGWGGVKALIWNGLGWRDGRKESGFFLKQGAVGRVTVSLHRF